MSEQQRSQRVLGTFAAGVMIGVVEALLAISFAALVFGGRLIFSLDDGIGLYLGAAAITLAFVAWRAGSRGVVGGVQEATAAVFAVVATTTALDSYGSSDRAFRTVVAATFIVMIVAGAALLVLGMRRRGNLLRFVPYPVAGGFLAGIGWLLMKGGIGIAANEHFSLMTTEDLLERETLMRWVPALAFGVVLLVTSRIVRRPVVVPALLGIGLVGFALVTLVTGTSLAEAREGRWLLGSFGSEPLWELWVPRALTGADWSAVLTQAPGILAAVFLAVVVASYHVSGTEPVLGRDLDTNKELRDAGLLHVVSGALGGIPASHSLRSTALAAGMRADARIAGLVGAVVALAAVVFGTAVVGALPRMVVGGVLVFLGLAVIVEWVWDKRQTLQRVEYIIVLVILAAIVARGLLPGVVIGLVMAVVLLAVSYGRIELMREVAFGDTYRSNVDRPGAERAALREMGDRVQVLRVHGFVFFGSANGLLERIRRRVEETAPRFLLLDLRRVTGVDASAVISLVKVTQLVEANGVEVVIAGASDPVREQLARGGVVPSDGVVRFEPDLDRGLQRCEDVLLAEARGERLAAIGPGDGLGGMPPRLSAYLEREPVPEGAVLIRQDEPPEDVFILESGRLRVDLQTREGRRVRLRSVPAGVVVGEIGMYTGIARTADVVAEEPSVVLRLRGSTIRRLESEEPALAAALHRWLAGTLAERLTDTQRVEAIFD